MSKNQKTFQVISIFLLIFTISYNVPAVSAATYNFETWVQKIVPPTGVMDPDYRVYSVADGRIYTLDARRPQLIQSLSQAMNQNAPVWFTLDPADPTRILDVRLPTPHQTERFDQMPYPERQRGITRATYKPTILKSQQEARRMFNSVYPYDDDRYDLSDNCFNRAHFWSRNWEKNNDIKTSKIFIFFTESYQRRFKHKWWYHVAPMTYVETQSDRKAGKIQEIVLDPSFINSPLTDQNWAATFAEKAKKGCAIAQSLDEAEMLDRTADCVLVKSSMYAWVPSDLNGSLRTSWRCSDFRSLMRSIPAPPRGWDSDFIPSHCR